jgi:hypothetical protein
VGRVRTAARVVTGAAGTVAVSVAANQVLSEGRLSWNWAYVSIGLAILAGWYGEVLAAPAPTARPPRWRRRTYVRQVRASVEDMEILGVATQSEFTLRMRQVYVDVSLEPKPGHEIAREPYVGAAPLGRPGERRSLESFLNERTRGVLAVIGGPGSGKTTLVRNTALELCGRRRPLPILMYLRDHAAMILAGSPPDLSRVATSAGWLDGKVPAEWVSQCLDRGGCVVLLDGLDEVADEADRGRVVAWIQRQVQRYPDNRWVVTSRPHGYRSSPLPAAEMLQVRRFTGEQISRFLHGWYTAIEGRAANGASPHVRKVAEGKADDLLGRLSATPALYDLAANPLLLTMIANVHRYRGQLPGSRAALYAEMYDVLLHRRQEARNLTDATGLRGPQKERVARDLALAMMQAKVRDLPAAAASEAVGGALRALPGDVEPLTFLEEARKSGLLVEREHGVYGFAHLSMQEYLAAARIGPADVGLLIDNVADSWWRETTLLWASDNDATPVVTACLASGTIGALSLAFDCADGAEVDPGVREQLEDMLIDLESTDEPDRLRLLAGIAALRSLREVIRLDEDIAMCARPVPRSLYALFVRHETAAGHYTISADQNGDGPASGLWAGDVGRFVTWLNSLFDDGTAYRLPTDEELADPAAGLVADLRRGTAWACGDRRPRRQTRRAIGLNLQQVRRQVVLDRRSTTSYLRLALTEALRHNAGRVLAYSELLRRALRPGHPDLEFVRTCALVRTLDRARHAALGSVHHPEFFAAAIERVRAFGFPVDLAKDVDLPITFAQARDSARVLAADLAGDRGFRALDIDQALETALDRAFHDTDRLLVRDLDINREHGERLEIELSLANHHQLDDIYVDDLTVTLDLVGDLATASWPLDTVPLPLAVRAYGDLLSSWVPAPWNGKPGEFLNNFDYALVALQGLAEGEVTHNDVLLLVRA